MKRYSSYKPSNIDWLGDIPENWEIKRAKYLGNAIIGLTYSPEEVVNEGEGVLILRSSNIQNGKIVFSDNVYVKKNIPENLFTRSGDILICSRNGSVKLIGKNVLIDKNTEGLSFGAFMTIFRSQYYDFLYYFFNSNLFTSQSGLFSTSTINQLTTSILNNMQIPTPPLDAQQIIVDFLKKKTKKIDDLVTKKQKIIDFLKEERITIINQAVTKGINPDAETGDSGIEWLGKIPLNWRIEKAKYCAKINRLSLTEDTNSDNKIRYIDISNVSSDGLINPPLEMFFKDAPTRARRVIRKGDTIVSTVRTYLKAIAFIDSEESNLIASTGFAILTPVNSIIPKYLFYLLTSQIIINSISSLSKGVSYPAIDSKDLANINIWYPSNIIVQEQIVNHIEIEISKIKR